MQRGEQRGSGERGVRDKSSSEEEVMEESAFQKKRSRGGGKKRHERCERDEGRK